MYSDRTDPADTIIDQIADIARKSGANLVIGLGGGSSLDAAKSVAGLLTNEGLVSEYYAEDQKGFVNATAPIILIPTAAGTGSEVTVMAVVTDTKYDKLCLFNRLHNSILSDVPPKTNITYFSSKVYIFILYNLLELSLSHHVYKLLYFLL